MRSNRTSIGSLCKAVLSAAGAVALTPWLLFLSTTNTLFIRNAVDFSNDIHVLTQFFVYFCYTFVLGLFLFLLARLFKPRLAAFPFWVYLLAGPFLFVYAYLHGRAPGVMDRLAVCGTFVAFHFSLAGILTWKGKVKTAARVASHFYVTFLLIDVLVFAVNSDSRHISSENRADVSRVHETEIRRPNIYHILLDMYQTDVFERTLTPDVRSQLAGYQYYPENITVYGSTLMSVPSVFLGRLYPPDTPQRAYAYEAFNSEASFLHSLIEHGYDTSALLSVRLCEGAMSLLQHVRMHGEYADIKFAVDSSAEFKNLWIYAHFPAFVVRRLVPETSIEDLKGGQVLPKSQPIYSYASFQRFLREEESLPGHNRFTFLHMMLPHPPFVLRSDGSFGPPSGDGSLPATSFLEQARCTTSLIVQFTNRLRELGRFDDSMIVFHADHGIWALPSEVTGKEYVYEPDPDSEERASVRSRALLLLKLPGRDVSLPLEVCDAEATLLDIAPTVLDAVGFGGEVTYAGISLARSGNVPINREREYYAYKGASFGQGQLADSFVRFAVSGRQYTREGKIELTRDNARGFLSPEEGRFFNGDHPVSEIQYGGFEEFPKGARYPTGWGGLLPAPMCEPEEGVVKFGKRSLKVTSSPTDGDRSREKRVIALTTPPIERLGGKEVLFGAWLRTSRPENVRIQIIDSWKRWHSAKPLKKDEWGLVTRRAVISKDADEVIIAIAVTHDGESPTECYVDGGALLIHD